MSVHVLIIGSTGQLARALAGRNEADLAITCAGRTDLNLAEAAGLETALDAHAPDVIINAAAYTAVDKAETEPDAAFALNRDGPGALARLCAARGIALVHISTDYVFDGAKPSPYLETDHKAPQSVYGCSKSEGEDAVLAAHPDAAILRTSWVYSAHGANFVRTMLRLAAERDVIRVVADQWGRPTWASDLADACIAIARAQLNAQENASGIFHYSGGEDATWADFARAIFAFSAQHGGPIAHVENIATADYPTPATRPRNSRLDTSKFTETFNLAPRPWRESLALCMRDLMAAKMAN